MKAYLVPLSLICSSYVLMPDYRMSTEKKPFELEGYYRQAKGANVTTKPYKGSKIKIMEYDAGASYNFKINDENFLSFGLGTFHQTVNWNQNPAFHVLFTVQPAWKWQEKSVVRLLLFRKNTNSISYINLF